MLISLLILEGIIITTEVMSWLLFRRKVTPLLLPASLLQAPQKSWGIGGLRIGTIIHGSFLFFLILFAHLFAW